MVENRGEQRHRSEADRIVVRLYECEYVRENRISTRPGCEHESYTITNNSRASHMQRGVRRGPSGN